MLFFSVLFFILVTKFFAPSKLWWLSPPTSPNDQNGIRFQSISQWYCCAVCFERLFRNEHIVGSMGLKTEFQLYTEQRSSMLFQRRFLIIDWTHGTKLRSHTRYCCEGVEQYASSCPNCHMYLNVPVQMCLARTSAPATRRKFRQYKRFIRAYSAQYQLIRTLLLETEILPPF